MKLQAAAILDDSDLTDRGRKILLETGYVDLESFPQEVRFCIRRSNLVLFIQNAFSNHTTHILKNRYGNTGTIKKG